MANDALQYLLPNILATENIGIDETISVPPNPASLAYTNFLKQGKTLEIV